MRIALVSTLATPVRRDGSGSVESHVWLLARELEAAGHRTTVFGCAGSSAAGEVITTLAGTYGAPGVPGDWQQCEWINLCAAVARSQDFDVIHSHSYLHALPLQQLSRAPIVSTLHMSGDDEYAQLWRLHPDSAVTAISHTQWAAYPDLRPVATIHHGLDEAQFSFCADPEDYVCFLGRFTPGKNPLLAIEVARALGLRLRLAGPANDYFRAKVAPLVDGQEVVYVGTVTGETRDTLLGGARALLYPTLDAEPFGLVMAEAMMCGTPVAALALGAAPEIVDAGVTGALAADPEGFPAAVSEALQLDRAAVRRRAEARFAGTRMAREYLDAYQALRSGKKTTVEGGEHETRPAGVGD